MLTITGNGRLTEKPVLRHTNSEKAVTNVRIASDRRNRDDEPVYVELVLWETQAENAAEYLVKGQAVSFSGRPETRAYLNKDGEAVSVLEIHGVNLEYGAKPRDRSETADGPVEAAA
jgi:single stranded DNA-binding protein